MTSASYNNVNELTGTSAGGPTRFQGTLNEPGKVTVAGQAAWMQGATNFIADVVLTNGTNTVAVVATDASTNSRTNTYRMVLSGGGSTSPTYDANGNMLSDGTQTYGWDAANRLVKVTYGSGATSEFSYDAFGRRVKIVEKNSAGTVTSTRQFLYDGLAIAEQRDATNTVVRRYFEDGWRDVAGGVSYTVTKDHLGSIREVVDGSGNLVSRYDYDPYGRVTKVSGTVDSDMLYTGHYHHGPSGLHLALYRAYDPDIARWLSPDPIGEAGGVNLYAYVENNPVNLWDPWGLIDIDLHGPKDPQKAARDRVAELLPDSADRVTVFGHGSPSRMLDQRHGSDNPMSPKQLADEIRKLPGFKDAKDVVLYSCNTGKGSNSFGQQLARELGLPVWAPTKAFIGSTDPARPAASYGTKDGKPDYGDPGSYRQFN